MKIKLLLIFLGLTQLLNAQIQKAGNPWTSTNDYQVESFITHQIAEAPANWETALQDILPELKPYVFAWPVDTLILVYHPDNRIFEDANIAVYLLSIKSKSTYSINLIFSSYKLPKGAKLFLYNPSKDVVWGAYTDLNNKESGILATTPVPGEEIVIELVVNKRTISFEPELCIGRISLDQTNSFGYKSGRFGMSQECNVDINCPAGAEWQSVKRSVSKFIVSGFSSGSGALINNTANDGRPFFLTANHVIKTASQASSSVFYFNYESPNCNGDEGRLDHSISGAKLLATTSKLDFALIELTVAPPESYEPYYAGWDRTSISFNDSVTCIHHPRGDVKKISKSNRRIATGTFGGGYDENTHWRILEWDLGTTEGGSSGSPLFNSDMKIIGDLTGGDASCSYNHDDYYQKLSVSWDKYPEPDEQLKYWLDPLELNPMSMNAYDPLSKGKPEANFSYMPDRPLAGKFIRLRDGSKGSPDSWQWTIMGGVPEQSSERNPRILFETAGSKTVQLIIENAFGKDTLQRIIQVSKRIDFTASQNRLVIGSEVNLMADTDDNYSDLEWQIEEGPLSMKYFSSEIAHTYQTSGHSSVRLSLEYPGESYALYHQNFFEITSSPLIFKGKRHTLISGQESLGTIDMGESGVIPGSNTVGYTAYANAFRRDSDTVSSIRALVVDVLQLHNDYPTYLKAGVWNSDWTLLTVDSVLLNPKTLPFRVSIWLDKPVAMDTLVYAGFFVPNGNQMTFASGLSVTRNETERNDAWVLQDTLWMPLNQVIGQNSAFGIQLETTTAFHDFESQFKVLVDNETNSMSLDLSNLVYKEFELDIYDLQGRKIAATSNHNGSYVDVNYLISVSGVYLLRIRLDDVVLTKKVLLLKN